MKYLYDAFISYRHMEPDAAIAKKLAKALETYGIPRGIQKALGKKKMGKVFRDQDELPTAGSLSENIDAALRDSEWLIVICSPDLVNSKWCMKEIDTFIEMGRRDRILTLLVRGEPQESFPPQLCYITDADGMRKDVEPLAADIRTENFGGMQKKLKTEKLRLIAPILGVGYDDLRRRARERRLRMVAAATLGIAVAAGAFGVYAFDRAKTIEAANVVIAEQRDEALLNQSEFVTSLAREAYAAGNREAASMALLEVLPKSLAEPERPIYADAIGLLRTMEIDRGSGAYVRTHVYPGVTYDVKLYPDGRVEALAFQELIERKLKDRWVTPNSHYYLSPDSNIALQKAMYAFEGNPIPADTTKAYYEVKAFEYPSMTPLSTFRPYAQSSGAKLFVNGRYAAAGMETGVVVWDVYSGERLFTLEAGIGDQLAERKAFRQENPLEGVTVFAESLGSHAIDRVKKFALSENGDVLLLEIKDAEMNPTICGYEVRTGEKLWTLQNAYLWRFADNGEHFTVYHPSETNTETSHQEQYEAPIYSTRDGRLLKTIKHNNITAFEFGGENNDVYLFADGLLSRYTLHDDTVTPVVTLVDCREIDVSLDGETILVQDYQGPSNYVNYVLKKDTPGMTQWLNYVGGSKSGDGKFIFLYSEGLKTIDVYKAEGFEKVNTLVMALSGEGLPVFSYDGSRMFYYGQIYDTATGERLNDKLVGTKGIGFSQDNTRLLAYAETRNEVNNMVANLFSIRCYDVATGDFLFAYGGDEQQIRAYGIRIEGDYLIFSEGLDDYGMAIYNVYTGELVRKIRYPNDGYRHADFFGALNRLAIVDFDKERTKYDVVIYDTHTGEEIGNAEITHFSETSSVNSVLFKDAETYYAVSTDSVIEVDVRSGKILKTVFEATAEADLRNDGFKFVSADRSWFMGKKGHIRRLTDGALYAYIPSLANSVPIVVGNDRIIDFGLSTTTWYERGETRRHGAKPIEMFTLRTDQAVFDAAALENADKTLLPQEREAFFLN